MPYDFSGRPGGKKSSTVQSGTFVQCTIGQAVEEPAPENQKLPSKKNRLIERRPVGAVCVCGQGMNQPKFSPKTQRVCPQLARPACPFINQFAASIRQHPFQAAPLRRSCQRRIDRLTSPYLRAATECCVCSARHEISIALDLVARIKRSSHNLAGLQVVC